MTDGLPVEPAEPTPDVDQEVFVVPPMVAEGGHFEGLLSFRERAEIRGSLRGRIRARGRLLLGPASSVEASIEVDEVVVAGRVAGDIRARKRVELLATARVCGDLEAPRISLAEGCTLDGRCRSGPGVQPDVRPADRRPNRLESGPNYVKLGAAEVPATPRTAFAESGPTPWSC